MKDAFINTTSLENLDEQLFGYLHLEICTIPSIEKSDENGVGHIYQVINDLKVVHSQSVGDIN